jgi:hypothetical protein
VRCNLGFVIERMFEHSSGEVIRGTNPERGPRHRGVRTFAGPGLKREPSSAAFDPRWRATTQLVGREWGSAPPDQRRCDFLRSLAWC